MKNEIYIVAGGASLKNFDFKKLYNKDVIAINKSILDVQWAKYFITMDYTFIDHIARKTQNKLTRDTFSLLPSKKYFVVAKDNSYIKLKDGVYTDIRSQYTYDLKEFDEIIVSHNPLGIGQSFYEFVHGCNSGYSAIQLGLLLGYKVIHLLGFDLNVTDITHYHGGYFQKPNQFQKKLDFYYQYFIVGLHNIKLLFSDVKLYNYAPKSKLNSKLPYKSLKEIK